MKEAFCFYREIWIQPSHNDGIRVFRNVHNGFCVFLKGKSFLEFDIDACIQIVDRVADDKGMVNQNVGPKL